MRYKIMLLAIFLVSLLAISAVSAADTNESIIASEIDNQMELSLNNEITIEENVLTANDDSADESSNPILADANVNIVTNGTFFNYFAVNGALLSNVTSDELIFEGEFGGLGIDCIFINKPVVFKGNGTAFFNGITFVVSSNNVTIDGFSIFQKNNYGIRIKEDNVVISNNYLEFEALDGVNSYGIYASSNNLQIIDNIMRYTGNTDGTVINNGVRIEGDDDEDNPVPASNIVVSGNEFELMLPSVDVAYDPVTWYAVTFSEGIVFYYCEDLEFVDNRVNLKYNNFTTAYGYDSLYAVSVRSDAYTFGEVQSCDILIANNTINLKGCDAVYAVYVCADGFEVSGNNINVSSERFLCHGIDVDGPSAVGAVIGNDIVAESPFAAYGIYSYQYLGAIENISYSINTIDVTGYASAGMEIVECNPEIMGNVITAEGNYTYGIIASIKDEGVISENNITVLGSNIGDDSTGDGLMLENSLALSVKGSSTIVKNTLESTGIGINLFEDGKITVDNNTINVKSNTEDIDNHAVFADTVDYLVFTNNEVNYAGATTPKGEYKAAKAYAMYVVNSKVNVENNTFFIVVPSIPSDWESVGDDWIRHSYTEGLVFNECDFSKVVNNEITVGYNGGDFGSIYAIDVLDCDNFVIEYNDIEAYGEYYMYGIIVEGDAFTISNNNISLESEYYTNGIDIEESTGGIIDKNVIVTFSPETAYPIYGGMVGEPSVEITNNTIVARSYFIVGVELSGKEVTLNYNLIDLKGNYTIGIGVFVDELIANNNTIRSNASNIGDVSIWDSIATDTTAIKSKKGTVTIIDNFVETTGNYTVDIADNDGTVHDNYLTAKKRIGDNSVYSTGDAKVYDNTPNIKVVLFASDLEKVYDDGQLFTVVALNENGEPVINRTIYAAIGDLLFEVKTDEKGVAEFDIELPEGVYKVTTDFLGDEVYGPRQINNTITITTKDTVIVAPESVEVTAIEVKQHDAVVNIWLTDVDGKPLANKSVVIEFNGVGDDFITDENATVKYVLWGDAGNYSLVVKFKGDECYAETSTTVNVTVNKISTEIEINASTGEMSVGAIVPVSAKLSPSEAGNLTYVSNDTNVATVSPTGIILAKGAGTALITISFNGTDDYAAAEDKNVLITVNLKPASVSVNNSALDLIVNDTFDLIAHTNPAGLNVTFVPDNSGVVSVDENGTVTALKAGNAIIVVKVGGDGVYSENSTTVNVAVKYPTEISVAVPVLDLKIREEFATGATLTPADAGNLTYTSSDEKVVIVVDGKIVAVGVGNATVTVSFAGNDKYLSAESKTINVSVSMNEATIDIEPKSVEVTEGKDAVITVVLPEDASGIVLVDVGDKKFWNNIENGNATVILSGLTAGEYTADVIYPGDDKYYNASGSVDVKVNALISPVITIITPEGFKIGEPANVTVVILNATGIVSVFVDDWQTDVILDETGTAVVPIEMVTSGEHSVVAIYSGDDKYASSVNSTTFDAPVFACEFRNITVDGHGLISGCLVAMDTPIANATITYIINGIDVNTTTDDEGMFSFNVSFPAKVLIGYAGSGAILPEDIEITLKDIASTRTASVIKAEDYTTYAIEYYIGERGNFFNVQLVDEKGNPLANKTVKIGFNGRIYDTTTNSTGWAGLQINLKNAGTYSFAVAFLGDDDYNASFVVQKIIVNKKKTSISASAKSYKASAKTKKYTVTLKTDKGSSIDGKVYMESGKKVTLKLNGKTYTAKTNSKGQATFSLKITKKGKFSTAVKFEGDNTYASSSKSVKITIN